MIHGRLRTDYFNPYRDEPRKVDYDQVSAEWEARFAPAPTSELRTTETLTPLPQLGITRRVPNLIEEFPRREDKPCTDPNGHCWTRQGKCGVQKRYRVKCGICKITRRATESEYFAIKHNMGPKGRT